MIRPSSSATTRRRSDVTISASWVAIRIVTPISLIRSSSWMISQLMTGSRFPVGSSAMMIRGSWTSARAIAVRCCSPPESWVGTCSACPVRPTRASTRSTAGRILRRGVPVTSSANATFSQTDLRGSSLKSWNTIPILRRTFGTWRRLSRARSSPSTTTIALGRQLVADQQLRQRGLPGARRADEEHEVALGDDELDVLERLLAVRVAHRDVVQDDDRLVARRSGAARPVRRSRRDGVGLGATVKGVRSVTERVEAGTGLPVGCRSGCRAE